MEDRYELKYKLSSKQRTFLTKVLSYEKYGLETGFEETIGEILKENSYCDNDILMLNKYIIPDYKKWVLNR